MRRSLRWLLASTAAGSLGDGLATTALPLLLINCTTDPVLVALLQVASGLPWLLFSLHAGVVVDRADRRAVLWIADASRTALAAVLVGVAMLHIRSVTVLLAIAFADCVAVVFFRAASPAMLPTLVAEDDLAAANSQIQIAAVVTDGFVGPALGGVLFAVREPLPFIAQSLSMLVSVLCLRRLPIRHEAMAQPNASTTVARDIQEGFGFVAGDRMIRSVVAATGLLAASTGMLQAVLVLHIVQTLHAPKAAYGVLFTVFAAGYLIGTQLAPRIRTALGERACFLAAAALGTASLVVIGCAPDVYVAGAGMGVLGIGSMIYNVSAMTLRQRRTPPRLLGRVSSIANLVGAGATPIAALIAGLVASAFGTACVILLAAGACACGFLWLAVDMGPIADGANQE